MTIICSSLELLGIVLLRFRPISRTFAFFLMLVNLFSLFFFQTIYGQVVFVVMSISVIIMVVIYSKLGFVRILGLGHILWIPMLIWIFKEFSAINKQSELYYWIVSLFVFNCISLVIDTVDVCRFIIGKREPYYFWRKD